MEKVRLKYLKRPNLRNPILIEGLPGIGYVGKLAVDQLIEQLGCKLFAVISSSYFPPAVAVRDGLVKLIRIEFYYSKNPDLIIVTGDSQAGSAEGHYQLAEKILEVAQEYHTNQIITLGGFGTGKGNGKPALYGAATDPELILEYSKYGIRFDLGVSSIIGAAGLLLGLGKDKNIKGVSILGETRGSPLMVDPIAAKSVLEVLGSILGIEIDTSELELEARWLKKKVKKMRPKILAKRVKESPKEELWYIG